MRVERLALAECDADLAPRLTREVLEDAVRSVPDEFLASLLPPAGNVERLRAAYVAFLWKRLHAPRPFIDPGRKTPFFYGS